MSEQETYTDQHREATGAILTSWMRQMIDGIAKTRNISEAQVSFVFSDVLANHQISLYYLKSTMFVSLVVLQ